jgi:putative SOS response-associated peptidase YedK
MTRIFTDALAPAEGFGFGVLGFEFAARPASVARMCVRYSFHQPVAALIAITATLARKLMPAADDPLMRPRFNVTLTHAMPVVALGEGGRSQEPGDRRGGPDAVEVRAMTWGLVPFYERKKPQRRMLPNAKAETAATLAA